MVKSVLFVFMLGNDFGIRLQAFRLDRADAVKLALVSLLPGLLGFNGVLIHPQALALANVERLAVARVGQRVNVEAQGQGSLPKLTVKNVGTGRNK